MQEYVKDLFIIGFIVYIASLVVWFVGVLVGIDMEPVVYLCVCGFLTMSYISFKHHYLPRAREDRYISIPAWVILMIVIALGFLYLWWRLS